VCCYFEVNDCPYMMLVCGSRFACIDDAVSKNRYQPRVASLPGATLADVLVAKGMSQAELAQRMGRPKKTVNEIVKGKTAITPDTALELERVLGAPSAGFWIQREQQYRESKARADEEQRLEEYEPAISKWNVPLGEMIKRGWIPAATSRIEKARALLSYFGVASPENWNELYLAPQAQWRRAANVSEKTGKIAAWLRRGETQGQEIQTAPFDRDKFQVALRTIRDTLLRKTKIADFLQAVQDLCAAAGVAVVVVEEFSGAGINAAARWLSPEKALIQLSYRGNRLDIFWFNFFHEAGHVLLHGKRAVFLDEDSPAPDLAVEEAEADRFASDHLIDAKKLRAFCAHGVPSQEDVVRFAREIGVDPCIVVGRLRKIEHVAPAFGAELMVDLGRKQRK
jgi:addiction module HigA family antidote